MQKENSSPLTSPMFQAMRRFYELGAAPLWLHPKSKRPIGNGWTTGPRQTFKELKESYRSGMNVGVRLGTPSQIENGRYLAVLDVDVKSTEKKHRQEARLALQKLVGDLKRFPEVASGRGGGSLHLYCVTKIPFKTFNLAESGDLVKVVMPSKSPSQRELKELTDKEIKVGIRISKAWEISAYSDGRQVVLPPSIHPDSNEPYTWSRPFQSDASFPLLDIESLRGEKSESESREPSPAKKKKEPFEFKCDETLDVRWLPDLPDSVRVLIVSGLWKGEKVADRSAYLMVAASGLFRAGLDAQGVLTVLTDKSTFLGECAFDHAKTKNRARAAYWLWNYTVKKVQRENDPRFVFENIPVEHARDLSDEETKAQTDEIEAGRSWQSELKRGGQNGEGAPKPTLNNTILVLRNEVHDSLFKRDDFGFRDIYGCEAPWGGKPGEILTDDDVAKIRHWLGKTWGFEPGKEILNDAVTVLACEHNFDPVKDWLESLPEWDRHKRLDTWLARYFEAKGDPEYLAQVFRKWMVAMVMRVYEPGSKFDWMPIFEGPQNMGKSSFGRLLVGDKFFLDWLPNLADKDSALSLQGMWAIEMGELASLRRNELETIKAYITRTVDKFRPPFGRRLLESPRRCVFYGTTNRDTYLRDETGNRRFKPIKVGALNFEKLREDREQLFAEAKYLFDSCNETGPTLYLSGQAAIYEKIIHQEKMVEDDSDLMAEVLLDFVEKYEEDVGGLCLIKFRLQDLFAGIGPLSKWRFDQKSMQLASRALKKIGATSWKSDGRKVWKLGK